MLRIRPFAEIRPFGKFTGFLMKGCKVDTASKFEGHLGPRYIYIYIYIYYPEELVRGFTSLESHAAIFPIYPFRCCESWW